ncbi:hypothetical protein [Hydrogenophaga sp. IBVHS1]|jgi:hypothetical protein|uniref:hypothetical protein n=1 Tax=unclassified Hydrogenophaga TaxID=2610897 RepID=UPI000A2D8D92|nr:hypothetical protein [Hydrogenophaga sp. IBVHS1]OSZ71446.1 hypothetical protein CAP37_19680 [Hydrogenophaga sp. IBVHS1]
MSVIPFPSSPSRSRSADAASSQSSFRPNPPAYATLDAEAVDELTYQDFFLAIRVDTEGGPAVISPDDEFKLVQYLEFHGLRLPSAVAAEQLRELCNTLRWTYGHAVRLAVRDSSDLARKCAGLSADKIAYVCAVASQQPSLARELARGVFKDRASQVFFY